MRNTWHWYQHNKTEIIKSNIKKAETLMEWSLPRNELYQETTRSMGPTQSALSGKAISPAACPPLPLLSLPILLFPGDLVCVSAPASIESHLYNFSTDLLLMVQCAFWPSLP